MTRHLIVGFFAAVLALCFVSPSTPAFNQTVTLQNARVRNQHKRPTRWLCASTAVDTPGGATGDVAKSLWNTGCRPDPASYVLLADQTVTNVKTNAGIDFLHTQGYGLTGVGTNGLNYIALSNDSGSPLATDTTLAAEIATNGLARAQGTVTHTPGTTTTVIDHTFTCTTAPQSAQKAMLFSASSSGTGNHEILFTQRALQIGDQIDCTFTITLS